MAPSEARRRRPWWLVGSALLAVACSSGPPKGSGLPDGAPPDAGDGDAPAGDGADGARLDAAAESVGDGRDAAAEGGGGPSQSVLTRNNHNSRDGFFVQPELTKAMAARFAPETSFQAPFAGAAWGSLLYVEDGPTGRGVFIVATTDNAVYALDETTGAVVWRSGIGEAPQQTGIGCNDLRPIGVISTPVIDAATRTIYVAGAVGPGDIQRHEIHALSVDDGLERPGFPVDASSLTGPGGLTFNAKVQNQRGALSLVGGTLYVPYGAHPGDCGTYHGWVVAVDTADPKRRGAWVTASGRGEGVWATGGMASDGDGVFAVTGNRVGDSPTHQDSEEVVRVTGLGDVDRSRGVFYPSTWRNMDAGDQDFGASSPVLVELPGAAPEKVLVAAAKDGNIYLLDPSNLGGMGGELQRLNVGGGNSIRSGLGAYVSSTGTHVVLNLLSTAPCGGGRAVITVKLAPIGPTALPEATLGWCAPTTGEPSPIATSTDGQSETVVWYLDGGALKGVDGDSGAPIYADVAATCAGLNPRSAPIAVKGRIVAAADGHLCAWSAR